MQNSNVTYQGEALQSLIGQLDYCNLALNSNLEKWERKEFEAVKVDVEFKINSINERLEELNA